MPGTSVCVPLVVAFVAGATDVQFSHSVPGVEPGTEVVFPGASEGGIVTLVVVPLLVGAAVVLAVVPGTTVPVLLAEAFAGGAIDVQFSHSGCIVVGKSVEMSSSIVVSSVPSGTSSVMVSFSCIGDTTFPVATVFAVDG